MKFSEIIDQASALLQRKGRLTYRALKLEFALDDEQLDVLKEELIDLGIGVQGSGIGNFGLVFDLSETCPGLLQRQFPFETVNFRLVDVSLTLSLSLSLRGRGDPFSPSSSSRNSSASALPNGARRSWV